MRADAAQPPPEFAALLDEVAPFTPVPLCPEILAFQAISLVAVWTAAEQLAGIALPAPFWAFAWPAGSALARVILDQPELVRGRRVLDLGAGGGVGAIACARAGARRVVANDIDAWALEVTRIAAVRQHVAVETLLGDLTGDMAIAHDFDVVLAADLAYERSATPRERGFLEAARRNGAVVLIADAERTYFDASGLNLIAEYMLPVVYDLEGKRTRVARVYRMS
jgi:predicted nicotinamide N-methyase